MARIDMKLRLAQALVAVAALLGAAAAYAEISRIVALPTDAGLHPGESGASLVAARPAVESRAATGNPLWAIPLEQLSGTRERPIFSSSRRPPPPPMATPVRIAPIAPRAAPAEPERPAISLVGTVASKTQGIGVFIEPATQNIVRLRVGDDHQGWVLRSVRGRMARLEKNRQTIDLELPAAGGDAATVANTAPPDRPPERRTPRR
jgi:hypothetical protein